MDAEPTNLSILSAKNSAPSEVMKTNSVFINIYEKLQFVK